MCLGMAVGRRRREAWDVGRENRLGNRSEEHGLGVGAGTASSGTHTQTDAVWDTF